MKVLFLKITWCWMLVCALAFAACSESDKEVPENSGSQTEENKPSVDNTKTEMNKNIDNYLTGYYLWNEEYKGMTRDLTIPYEDSYENFLQTTLMKMTGNKLDKKKNSSGKYSLYSYIDRTEKKVGSKALSAGVNHNIKKDDKVKSYGFSSLSIVNFINEDGSDTGDYGFVVQSVYPASPASTFDINRGFFILEVDGEVIDGKNYMNLYLELMQPTRTGITLLVSDGSGEPEEISLVPTEVEHTPILMNKIIEEGGAKIGYIVYNAFDAGYDNDMLDVLAQLNSANITDLVLDLRYNGGGHVISSMMLSGCLAGSGCSSKVFQYYRYNDARMKAVEVTKKETGNEYDASAKYFYDLFYYDNYYGVNLSSYDLSHTNLYVLTTEGTASASEVLISSLRGIDVPITVIGEKTNGKNVGMEVLEFDKGNYSYELAPITFQYYNAKQETVPETGMNPDYRVADWNDGYVNFGEKAEPMLAKAIELITGSKVAKAESRGVSTMKVKRVDAPLPELKLKRLQGAIYLNK